MTDHDNGIDTIALQQRLPRHRFSLDSIIAAVGMVDNSSVMIAAVIVSIGLMMLFAINNGSFVSDHPIIKVLTLWFLLVAGMPLVVEGFGHHVTKCYIYFAMVFSLRVEMLNLRLYVRNALNPYVSMRHMAARHRIDHLIKPVFMKA